MLQAAAACACLLGVCMGEIGVSIMHDANHGAGLPWRWGRYALGLTLDLVRPAVCFWPPAMGIFPALTVPLHMLPFRCACPCTVAVTSAPGACLRCKAGMRAAAHGKAG